MICQEFRMLMRPPIIDYGLIKLHNRLSIFLTDSLGHPLVLQSADRPARASESFTERPNDRRV